MSLLTFNPHSDRIKLANSRLKAAYAHISCQDVPVVEPNVCADLLTTKETLDDLDCMLEKAVRWANNLAATDNDWPPVILGYCGVVMVAEAFGCPVIFRPSASPWAKPVITDINQVKNLKPTRPEESPVIKRHFEWIDYSQRKLGSETPSWTLDIQSPFSVAEQIVEPNELFTACITNPQPVHQICQMITDYTIEMMKKLLEKTEHPGFPGANYPCISEDIGLCLADDTPLIMLSPEMYREFALPYNNQLGEYFGGLHIHSCGNYAHNIDNLLGLTNVRSIQLHAGPGEFQLPESSKADHPLNRARSKLAFFVDTNDVARGDIYQNRYRNHYSEYVLPRLCDTDCTGFILQSCGAPPEADINNVNSAIKWTRQQVIKACKSID